MRRPLVVATLVGFVALTVGGAYGLARSGLVGPSAEAPVTTRDLIARKVAEDLPRLTTPAQLDPYLDGLLAQARAKGQPTALEVDPGVQAIARFRSELGNEGTIRRTTQFVTAMNAIRDHAVATSH
jgi:hypothetical protein